MIVSLWNSDLVLSASQVERLQDHILKRIAAAPDERQSVSWLVDDTRSATGIAFPTRMVDAESMFKALGFKLEREHSKRNPRCVRRTYVTL